MRDKIKMNNSERVLGNKSMDKAEDLKFGYIRYDDYCSSGLIKDSQGFEIYKRYLLSSNDYHAYIFRKIYRDLFFRGKQSSPRGLNVLEIENYNYRLPPYVRFTNFEDRKFNLNYVKREFLWYLRGDRYDTSITEHASMWKSLICEDGGINSNYGQYIFGDTNQFSNVVKILTKDKDSRRASIVILSSDHLLDNKAPEIPCTYSLNFRIRNDVLNMTVRMRSQDAVLGMSSDLPIFSFIHEMIYAWLKDIYPNLIYGEYYHSCDSFHVYEKHYEMVHKLAFVSPYKLIDCPVISGKKEVEYLLNYEFSSFEDIPAEYKFVKWLTTFDEIK